MTYSMTLGDKRVRGFADLVLEVDCPTHHVKIIVIRRKTPEQGDSKEEICEILDGGITYHRKTCRQCGETFFIAEFPTKTGRPDNPRQRPNFYDGCRVAKWQHQVVCPDCTERRKVKYSGDHVCAICGKEIPTGAKRRDARFCDGCDTPAKRRAFYRNREKKEDRSFTQLASVRLPASAGSPQSPGPGPVQE